jgi:isopentenyl diphosphate isomerase/L-lactate dehydrogenase-like FMN-dependent dehydrogenase
MKVFINYSPKDRELATELVSRLKAAGLDAWFDKSEILPGDNWAEKTSEGLKESDAMVVLLTPNSLASETVQANISYALGEKSFRHRVVPVLVGDVGKSGSDSIPWILKKLKPVSLGESQTTEAGFNEIVQALKSAA